jgi:hypothetical protein
MEWEILINEVALYEERLKHKRQLKMGYVNRAGSLMTDAACGETKTQRDLRNHGNAWELSEEQVSLVKHI